MYISKFEVKSFRCFIKKQTLSFAIPKNKKVGSGLTFLVGENNSGKTSLLEAMKFSAADNNIDSSTLRSSDILNSSIRFAFYDMNSKVVQQLSLLHKDACVLKNTGANLSNPPIFIPSRRYWSPQVLNQYPSNQPTPFSHRNTSLRRQINDGAFNDSTIADYFNKIQLDNRKRNKFLKLMRSVFPNFQSFTTEHEDRIYITYKTTDNQIQHRVDFLGDGVSSVMLILAYLMNSNNKSMLVIDEPELSLHPTAQKRLIKLLAKQSYKRQILIATHSPYMVDWEYIKNGARVNRLVHDGKESNIYKLQEYSIYQKLVHADNWHHPFNSNIMAKEIFFSDKILFTEGKDDACLLSNDGQLDDDINIFSYGVGGCESFKLALTLADDIGIQKAAVIIDGGERESKIAKQLEKDFGKYLIVQWNKHDIRDKDGRREGLKDEADQSGKYYPPVEGYFTAKGKRKPDESLDDYYEKMQKINQYFLQK